jgi:hypothetical protein
MKMTFAIVQPRRMVAVMTQDAKATQRPLFPVKPPVDIPIQASISPATTVDVINHKSFQRAQPTACTLTAVAGDNLPPDFLISPASRLSALGRSSILALRGAA